MFKLKHKNNANLHNTQRSHQLPEPHSAAALTGETKKKITATTAAPAAKTKAAAAPINSSKPTLRKLKKIYTVTLAHRPQS